jgi:hypothetical protein
MSKYVSAMTALKVVLAAACVCAAIPANGAFEAKPLLIFHSANLECAITRTSEGYKRDADPIYKIVVSVSVSEDGTGTPTSMTVSHVSAGGEWYTRDKQYTKSNLSHTRGKVEYFWTGTMVRNSAITMRGTLWENSDGWFYSEKQLQGSAVSFWMISRCHEQEGEGD